MKCGGMPGNVGSTDATHIGIDSCNIRIKITHIGKPLLNSFIIITYALTSIALHVIISVKSMMYTYRFGNYFYLLIAYLLS